MITLPQFLPPNARVGLRPILRLVYSIADAALVLKVSNAGPDCQAQTAVKLCQAGLLAWKFGLLFTTNPTLDSDAVT